MGGEAKILTDKRHPKHVSICLLSCINCVMPREPLCTLYRGGRAVVATVPAGNDVGVCVPKGVTNICMTVVR